MKTPNRLRKIMVALAPVFFLVRLAFAQASATNTPSAAPEAADKAWKEVLRASQPPMPPAEWGGKPTPEQLEEFRKEKGRQAGISADKMKDFYTRYPDHTKAAEAQKKYQELLKWATTYGETNRLADLQKIEADRLKDPNLSDEERFKLRFQMINRALAARRGDEPEAYLAEMEKSGRELIQEFPKHAEGYRFLLGAAESGNEVKARKLVKEIVAGNAPEQIKSEAEGLLRKLDALGKPVDIKFTALDGRKVDVTKMPGKVVLIDFWATWCGPCVAEIPNVKKAYDKLHPKGFEIVGISFDDDKEKLEKFVANKEMPWPQYFDGEGWGNKFGKQYGISGIPTMWLVDKKGVLREMNARDRLEGKVEELLAE